MSDYDGLADDDQFESIADALVAAMDNARIKLKAIINSPDSTPAQKDEATRLLVRRGLHHG